MSSSSASFTYTTPEPRGATTNRREEWFPGPSPITARDDEQAEKAVNSWNVATCHFQRRNRLETRLEELQKDVASLTLKLRSTGNRSTLDVSGFLASSKEPEEEWDSGKGGGHETSQIVEKRRKSTREELSGGARGRKSSKTLRELHDVTTERDQLKFELEKTKRALAEAEKKGEDAKKSRKAYDKLKAHCESLQESLNLSERIRIRQKKLLQKLQMQQQERAAKKKEGQNMTEMKKRLGSAEKNSLNRNTARSPKERQQESSAGGYAHATYDILDSLVASSHHHDDEENAGLDTHEQAPSEPTTASRSRTPRSVLKATTPISKQRRPDFDSLLQANVPQFSTRRPSRLTTSSSRRPSQTQVQQREAMRQAARWARSRGAAVDISTSTSQLATKKISTAARPKNSFLAPTQASLRRLQNPLRRNDQDRPPFVV